MLVGAPTEWINYVRFSRSKCEAHVVDVLAIDVKESVTPAISFRPKQLGDQNASRDHDQQQQRELTKPRIAEAWE